jgi:hypothetical protein
MMLPNAGFGLRRVDRVLREGRVMNAMNRFCSAQRKSRASAGPPGAVSDRVVY